MQCLRQRRNRRGTGGGRIAVWFLSELPHASCSCPLSRLRERVGVRAIFRSAARETQSPPHPALRATLSRNREKGDRRSICQQVGEGNCCVNSFMQTGEEKFLPPLPRAGEGWGEGALPLASAR